MRKSVFDFENNTFVINHVAIQYDGKEHKEKIYFRDKTKSKKGCRIFPLFPEVKEEILKNKLQQLILLQKYLHRQIIIAEEQIQKDLLLRERVLILQYSNQFVREFVREI